jgi:hypothetical protein
MSPPFSLDFLHRISRAARGAGTRLVNIPLPSTKTPHACNLSPAPASAPGDQDENGFHGWNAGKPSGHSAETIPNSMSPGDRRRGQTARRAVLFAPPRANFMCACREGT